MTHSSLEAAGDLWLALRSSWGLCWWARTRPLMREDAGGRGKPIAVFRWPAVEVQASVGLKEVRARLVLVVLQVEPAGFPGDRRSLKEKGESRLSGRLLT